MNTHPVTPLKDRNITYSTRSGYSARFIVDTLTLQQVSFKFSCSYNGQDTLFDITARAFDLQQAVSELQHIVIEQVNHP